MNQSPISSADSHVDDYLEPSGPQGILTGITLVPLQSGYPEKSFKRTDGVIILGRASSKKDDDPDSRSHVTPHNGLYRSEVVSRQHCQITWTSGGKVLAEDLKSTHGTFVTRFNDTFPVRLGKGERLALSEGDIVTLGKVVERENDRGIQTFDPIKVKIHFLYSSISPAVLPVSFAHATKLFGLTEREAYLTTDEEERSAYGTAEYYNDSFVGSLQDSADDDTGSIYSRTSKIFQRLERASLPPHSALSRELFNDDLVFPSRSEPPAGGLPNWSSDLEDDRTTEICWSDSEEMDMDITDGGSSLPPSDAYLDDYDIESLQSIDDREGDLELMEPPLPFPRESSPQITWDPLFSEDSEVAIERSSSTPPQLRELSPIGALEGCTDFLDNYQHLSANLAGTGRDEDLEDDTSPVAKQSPNELVGGQDPMNIEDASDMIAPDEPLPTAGSTQSTDIIPETPPIGCQTEPVHILDNDVLVQLPESNVVLDSELVPSISIPPSEQMYPIESETVESRKRSFDQMTQGHLSTDMAVCNELASTTVEEDALPAALPSPHRRIRKLPRARKLMRNILTHSVAALGGAVALFVALDYAAAED